MNTTTGNFVEREVDLGFTGGLASLGFARTYNSVLDSVGALGPGWASCADERLVLDEEGARWVWIVLGVVEGLNPWKDEDHARTQEVPR